MHLRNFLIGIGTFFLAVILGSVLAVFLKDQRIPNVDSVTVTVVEPAKPVDKTVRQQGSGRSGPRDQGTGPGDTETCYGTCGVKILTKPRANYTDEARQKSVQGNVTLRITFLASGQIGTITPVSALPYGLTEQAIAAARNIRFQPAIRDGVPYTKSMVIQYTFNIY